MKKQFTLLFFLSALSVFVFADLLAQTAVVTADKVRGCSPLTVNFMADQSQGTGLAFDWDFGNGNISELTNPSAVFITPGEYEVRLVVTDNIGATDTAYVSIQVVKNPEAAFQMVSPQKGCAPLALSFQQNSVEGGSGIVSYIWDFGDGNTGRGTKPNHLYTQPGNYVVSLIVEDANGCSDIFVSPERVEVFDGATLDFTTQDPRLTCEPQHQVHFEAAYTPVGTGPFNFLWEFSDGTSSKERNPVKTFAGYGSYGAKLTVNDQSTGCISIIEKPNYITLLDYTFEVATNVEGNCSPATVLFDTELSPIVPGSTITWDFGDGSTFGSPSDRPEAFNPQHTYTQGGTFQASVTVETPGGECDRTFFLPPLEIEEGPLPNITADVPISCSIPHQVQFDAGVEGAVSWMWDFGDGTVSTEAKPLKSYNDFGKYDVTLSYVTEKGCENTVVLEEFIWSEAPVVDFTTDWLEKVFIPEYYTGDPYQLRGGCIPHEVNFQDLSTAPTPIVNWEWDFGDGNSVSGADPTPSNTYTTEGYFPVTLTITTADGCTASFTNDSLVRAGDLTVAIIDTTGYPLQQCCSPGTFFETLSDTSKADFLWWTVSTGDYHQGTPNWDFGTTIPPYNYPKLDASLYVFNLGCMDSTNLLEWTQLSPPYASADLAFDPCELYALDSFTINDPLLIGNIDSIVWQFNGQNIINDFHPTFPMPKEPGEYGLGVSVWDFENGCSCNTYGEQFFPGAAPSIDITGTNISGCVPLTSSFQATSTRPGIVRNYLWDFGDGNTSQKPSPTHVYEVPGNYEVTLTLSDTSGCDIPTTFETLVAAKGPKAKLLAEANGTCLPLELTITDLTTSTDSIISRKVDLGNGTIYEFPEGDSVFQYTYNNLVDGQGITFVNIHYTVEDINGCIGQDSVQIRLANPVPQFDWEIFPLCDRDSLKLQLAGGDLVADQHSAVLWTFENLANGQKMTSDRFSPSIVLSEGEYSITLTVFDALGCQGSTTQQHTVQPGSPPAAGFSATPVEATCPPLLVSFTDTSTADGDPIVAWFWDFGDGNTSTERNPSRIYANTGSYNVSLTVTSQRGCTDTYLVPELIKLGGPEASMKISKETFCTSETVHFEGISTNEGVSYTWDFGNGGIGTGANVSYTYQSPGLRIVSLIVDDGLCEVTLTDTLTVVPEPNVALPLDQAFCVAGSVQLDAGVPPGNTGAFYQYEWNTGATTRFLNAEQDGEYWVVVTDPRTGCMATDTFRLKINTAPTVTLPNEEINVCEGTTISVTATPSEPGEMNWFLGEVLIGQGHDLTYTFPADTVLSYAFYADETGCVTTGSAAVKVLPPPQIPIPANRVGCEGDTLNLTAMPLNYPYPGATYSWEFNGEPLPQNSSTLTVEENGVYRVRFSYGYCEEVREANIVFEPLPVGELPQEPLLICQEVDDFVEVDAGKAVAYFWERTEETNRKITLKEPGVHYVSLFTESGCQTIDSVVAVNICPPKVAMPTAFTPNGDGLNDHFEHLTRNVDQFELIIYNRWGEVVFSSSDKMHHWNGEFFGEPAPQGIYPWVLIYQGEHPDYRYSQEKVGSVTLIR